MAKKKHKKRLTKKQEQKKEFLKKSIICSFMFIVVLCLSYLIFISNILQPKVNSITANYISFNNKNTTDMLRINNIKKMSDKFGKSIINDASINFKVTGNKDSDYKIIIYPIDNNINNKYIKFILLDDKELILDNLANMVSTNDGGKIIYTGKIKDNKKLTLNMWLSNEYQGKSKNNSFEIKIK